MIEPGFLYDLLAEYQTSFYAGVPDSLLKSFCAYITDTAHPDNHIISANEGSAIGLATGYHLATGKIPLVYMQNSGIGNSVNPLLSLVDPDVYSIPMVLMIGWRGEPSVHDEPQHVKQGKVTCSLLDTMGLPYTLVSHDENTLRAQIESCYSYVKKNNAPYALVVRKDIFAPYTLKNNVINQTPLTRESAIEQILLSSTPGAIFVATTGMASRELYELREKYGMTHENDFLTVGSMGHASQIALAIAMQKKNKNIICIDGDGAFLMHMGGLATIGTRHPSNFLHIVINNGAHDSVGGQPTVALDIDIPAIALACGYEKVFSVHTADELVRVLGNKVEGPTLVHVIATKGSRKDLGRPKESPAENKAAFMQCIMQQ